MVSIAVVWCLLLFFILFPLARLLLTTFLVDGRISLAAIGELLFSKNELRAFANSLILAFWVGFCGTALGFLFAFTSVRTNLPRFWERVLDASIILPLISPPFVTAITIIFSFGPRGLITYHLLRIRGTNVYGLTSTLISETITYFPLAYLTLKAMFLGIDPNVEDMGYSLGGSRWRVFRTITFPLTRPGLANSFLLLFAASIADFATPLILAGNRFPVLPTEAFLQITGLFDTRGGAVLSFILLVPSLAVFFLQRFWVSGRYYVTITGKAGARTQIKSVPPALRPLFLVACLLIAAAVLYFYVLLLYASIVRAFGANYELTWEHYRVIFTQGLKAITDTLIIAMVGMVAGSLYGVIVGYLLAKKRFRSRTAMEIVSLLNYSLPGTIVGIAYLIAFNSGPVVLTGTALIIIACNVFRYGAAGVRTTVATLEQIDPSIEEASASLGAGTIRTFRRVTVPLVFPALLSGLEVVFVRSMTAISATIFLVSINWILITVRVLENMTELELGTAAAYSVFVVVSVLVVMAVMNALIRLLRRGAAVEAVSFAGG